MTKHAFFLAVVAAAALAGCKPIQRLMNEIPEASVAAPTQTVSRAVLAGASVYLVGKGDDADGDDLSYLWLPFRFDGAGTSTITLYDYTSATAYFTPTVLADDGVYTFFFQVNDGLEDSKPVKVTVTVGP